MKEVLSRADGWERNRTVRRIRKLEEVAPSSSA